MKISLYQPVHAQYKVVKNNRGRIFKPAQLTMPYIAALTPEGVDVEIHDEILGSIDTDGMDGDLVGITAVTPYAPTAYKVAAKLRARGQKVVLGGPHASSLPEEAAQYVDAVVVGEAEVLWPQLVRDFQAGKMKKIYRNSGEVPIKNLPLPRWDLLDPENYIVPHVVQASRGCPFQCDFCALSQVYPGYRMRPVDDVIREVAAIPGEILVFWDDNIAGNPKYAEELFGKLKPLKKKWFGQSTLTIAKNRELVKLASESGCIGLFVGIESFSDKSLQVASKRQNKVHEYKEAVKLLARHGIVVMAGIMFGFDTDDENTFKNTLEGAVEVGIGAVAASIVTPFPGTGLFKRYETEGRLLHTDWSKYTSDEVVFRHDKLSPEDIESGHKWFGQNFTSYANIFKRWMRTGFIHPRLFWAVNYSSKLYFGG